MANAKLKFFLITFLLDMKTKIYKCANEDLSIMLIENYFWRNWGLMWSCPHQEFFLNNFFIKSVQTKIKKVHSCANNVQSNHEKNNYF